MVARVTPHLRQPHALYQLRYGVYSHYPVATLQGAVRHRPMKRVSISDYLSARPLLDVPSTGTELEMVVPEDRLCSL